MRVKNAARRMMAALMAVVMLLCLSFVTAFASVTPLSNAFNPRGYYLITNEGNSYWLSSNFVTGTYAGGGGASAKDNLGHSNISYTGSESGLDYIDAGDVKTICAITDHNPQPGYTFLIGYYRNSSGSALATIPNFRSYLPASESGVVRRSDQYIDPTGSNWWTIPVSIDLQPGTEYEFAFLRGMRANNGTSCVLAEGNKGYVCYPFTDEEQKQYDAHKYEEYQFVTSISPAGEQSNTDVDHTVTLVPMRYRIQTYADTSAWTKGSKEARNFLKQSNLSNYDQDKVNALSSLLSQDDSAISGTVKKQLQKNADASIAAMLSELQKALDQVKSTAGTDLTRYEASLKAAEEYYAKVKDQGGTKTGQYDQGKIDALKTTIDTSKSTISASSSQTSVNEAADALDNAVLAVKMSLVTEDNLIFYDSATGIYVTVPRGSVPDNVRLVVSEFPSGSSDYDAAVGRIDPEPGTAAVYRILFYDGKDAVKPTEGAVVQIPVKSGMTASQTTVYYLPDDEDGSTSISGTVTSDCQIFSVSALGTFALVENGTADNKEEKTEQVTGSGSSGAVPTNAGQNTPIKVLQTAPNVTDNNAEHNETDHTTVHSTTVEQRSDRNEARENPNLTMDSVGGVSRSANAKTILYIAIGLACAGLLAGILAFLKGRKGKETY